MSAAGTWTPPEWQPPGWPPYRPSPGPPEPPNPPVRRPLPHIFEPNQDGAWDVSRRLLERRIVLLSGKLDHDAAMAAAAALMLLDADSGDAIQLHVACPEAELDPSIMLAETIDMLRAQVHAVASGTVGGPAVAVYAAAPHRRAHAHALFMLRAPEDELTGNADQLAAQAEQHRRRVRILAEQIAAGTGQPPQRVLDDMRSGRLLTAEQAVAYGLVNELTN